MKKMNGFVLVAFVVVMSGCLKTRSQLRQEEGGVPLKRQTEAQRRAEADSGGEVVAPPPLAEDTNETLREMRGRIEALELQLNEVKNQKIVDENQAALRIQALETRQQMLEEALKNIEARAAAPPAPHQTKTTTLEKDAFSIGEKQFEDKKWKEAIVSYQKYRDGNPKGKQYAEATYKIGVCFQELKMRDAAKAFFEEVTGKFPKSKEAKKAAFRLKTLK